MKIEEIAKICHEVNKAYCESLGDDTQKGWEESPEWQKSSAINGVNFHINNPDMTPKNSHECWMEEKRINGWKYGEKKDPEKKEHPCYVEYDKLPADQKAKDYIFRQIVHSLKIYLES